MNRDLINTIELDWWGPGRARDVALLRNVTTTQVERVWFIAKEQGRLPRITRPKGGFDFEQLLKARAQAQSLISIPPITPATKADRLKEVA